MAQAPAPRPTPNGDRLFLYDHPVSSYAQKVRMALREKNLPFVAQTPANLGAGQPDAPFAAANPRQEVPALIVTPAAATDDKDANDRGSGAGPFAVFDSTTILMYLEDAYPSAKPLLPTSARSRAEARMIEDICDTHYEATNWAVGEIRWFGRATGSEADALLARAQEQTRVFQAWLGERLGAKPFFAGDALSYADIVAAPLVHRSVVYGYGPAAGSALQLWHARMWAIPSVRETWEEMEAATAKLASMGPSAFAPHGARRREYRDHRLEWMVKNGAIGIVEKGLRDDNIRFSWP